MPRLAQFPAEHDAGLIGQVRGARGAKRHVAGQGSAVTDRHQLAAFLVRCDQQRWQVQLPGKLLQGCGQRPDLGGRADILTAEERDAGWAIPAECIHDLGGRSFLPMECEQESLTDRMVWIQASLSTR